MKKFIFAIFLMLGIWSANSQEEVQNYNYNSQVVDVYDGDTITALCDLGFGIYTQQKFRLYGIDTPEIRGEERLEGLKVRGIVRDFILDKKVVIKTIKDKKGKYGRYLAIIFLDLDQDGKLDNLNEWLVENNYAKIYK